MFQRVGVKKTEDELLDDEYEYQDSEEDLGELQGHDDIEAFQTENVRNRVKGVSEHGDKKLKTARESLEQKRILYERQLKEDELYAGELGYALLKSLRGRSVGRRLRRKYFKMSVVQFLCGFSLFVIAIHESSNYSDSKHFDSPKFGLSIIDLSYLTSIFSLLISIITAFIVRFWVSLVSNRSLVIELSRYYTIYCAILFGLSTWLLITTFAVFNAVKDWNANAYISGIFAYYVTSVIFNFPLSFFLLFFTLDVSYLADEVEKGGDIDEIYAPDDPNVYDMRDVTFFQLVLMTVGYPVYMVTNMFKSERMPSSESWSNYYNEYSAKLKKGVDDLNGRINSKAKNKKKRTTIWGRTWKTLNRVITGKPVKKKGSINPEENFAYNNKAFQAEDSLFPLTNQKVLLFNANDEKDVEEMYRREEIEREKEFIIKTENEKAEKYSQMQQEKLENIAKKLRQEKEKENFYSGSADGSTENSINDSMPESPQKNHETNIIEDRWEAILTIPRFRTVWSSLQPSGSFTTNLLALPDFKILSNHIASIPGLHLVFSISNFNEGNTSTSLNDKHIMNFNMNNSKLPEGKLMDFGICNVRDVGDNRWFLARFSVDLKPVQSEEDPNVVSKTVPVFSAAMKSSSADIVSVFVKNFNLAKVLKIDTRR